MADKGKKHRYTFSEKFHIGNCCARAHTWVRPYGFFIYERYEFLNVEIAFMFGIIGVVT